MANRIVHIDEMVKICGYFTSNTTVNNAYGCKHPEQEETDIDFRTEKPHGKCYCFSCPLGKEADLQDMKKLDQELYNDWKYEDFDPSEMGGDYLVIDESVGKLKL